MSIAENAFSRQTPEAYKDGVYKMAGSNRPNPRLVSETVFKGPDGLPSYLNRTAMFAFFGKLDHFNTVILHYRSSVVRIDN